MPIFKYTVANSEGKKLSGTVEAPDEKTARTELNNLGFSILILQQTSEMPHIDNNIPKFVFEAIDKNSKLVSGTIPAKDDEEAFKKLTGEYSLTVTAIWPENSTEQQITIARQKWSRKLQTEFQNIEQDIEKTKNKSLEQEKEEAFVKAKIETILAEVNKLIQTFDAEFDLDQKAEINKQINKLLRIKNSTNLKYILQTAEELLLFIENQQKSLKEHGHNEKRLELMLQTKNLLNHLNRESKPGSISEDIVNKIENYEFQHRDNKQVVNFLVRIKNYFQTPPEIIAIKEQIKIYNKQLFDSIKLYFKEPTKEYKEKVKNTILTIWQARKKAKNSLKATIKLRRDRQKAQIGEPKHLILSFIDELNAFTGWLLGFYIIYYFLGIYLSTKEFGLTKIPKGFLIYESQFFKYALGILFLLHATTAIKSNFLRQNAIANLTLPIFFLFGSIIVLLNF
ncbi:hypothetical protein HY604_03090 [Candidatus Peregrinibacteria bacterium]|nr:hypothetical protein [Candidatus Peregrinibacteria bacterium]